MANQSVALIWHSNVNANTFEKQNFTLYIGTLYLKEKHLGVKFDGKFSFTDFSP